MMTFDEMLKEQFLSERMIFFRPPYSVRRMYYNMKRLPPVIFHKTHKQLMMENVFNPKPFLSRFKK